jgi:glutamine amidotransferase
MIVDYGMGNVRSVENALTAIGCDAFVSSDAGAALRADAFVLPGVGAFGEAMRNLQAQGMVSALEHEVLVRRKPILGICLGLQLMGETSEEGGHYAGLGWVPARVTTLDGEGGLKVPHMGWNEVSVVRPGSLFAPTSRVLTFYFAHSYVFSCPAEFVSATFDYGGRNVAAIQNGNMFGTQFHPERSSAAGVELLGRFAAGIRA